MLNLFQHPWLRTHRRMRKERQPCTYILASGHYGTLYIGVTSNLAGRLWQHRSDALTGFSQRYHVHRLIHFELFGDMERAITREKQLKNWHRQWKINLINAANPEWQDLTAELGLPAMAPGKPKDGS
ncbi:GIY-YIG nuclease family protein [Novosphingobium sp. BL-8H]|uniref:GIY-YIG nuclease family protein n=1 Tax=Novosphingobium sp. BL-8H TaxID=3127640 RepID=UPI003757AF1C